MLRIVGCLLSAGGRTGRGIITLALAEWKELVAQVARGGIDAAAEFRGAGEATDSRGRSVFVVSCNEHQPQEFATKETRSLDDFEVPLEPAMTM